MTLPRLYAITGKADSSRDWWERFEATLAAGHKLIQLRCPKDDTPALEKRARRARDLAHAAGARLLLNGPITLVRQLNLDGVHLSARALMTLEERPLSAPRLVAASCHSTAELAQARHLGADFACLSPVRPTASHPGAAPLGWESFERLAGAAGLPVYALGGVGPAHLEDALRAGAYGVAGISEFWSRASAR